MEKALERALDRAEYIIESARQRPPERKQSSSGGKSLHDKLYDLYVEECGKEPEVTEELISNVNLLEKLVQRESLSRLVVNLYPGKQGYSLMLEGPSEQYSETIQLPYEERTFLEYLDAEELPPALVDLLEKSELNIFHSGCVIAEVRDHRQGSNAEPPGYQSRHVLLRPTMQTLACDVQSITSDNREWTEEDKLLLESQLILATAEPLCLDPSVSVACTANRLLYNRQKMNTPAMRRNLKRHSTASPNEQQEPSCSPDPPQKSEESQAAQQDNLQIFKAGKCVDMWKQRPCDLAVPSEVDVEKYAREERFVKYDDSPLTEWPAYGVNDDIFLFGCEAGDQSQTTELTFMQSLGDPLISGQTSPKKPRCGREMSPCHSFKDDHCYSLMPESSIDTGEEVQSLFEELEPLSADCAFEVSPGSSGSGSLSQLSPEKEAVQPLDESVHSSVLEEGVQYTPPPISLLSSSGDSSSGSDSLTPQQESSFHKSISPAPAPKPPSLPHKSSVEVNRVSTLSTATPCTASSAQKKTARKVKAKVKAKAKAGSNSVKVAVPVPAAQTVVRGSNSTKGSTSRVRTPVPIKPKIPSSDQQLPDIQPAVQQAPSQGIQFIFKNVSEARPITLLQLPPGTLILNTQQQSQQQPQQKPQQQQPQQQSCQQPQKQTQQQSQQPQWQPLQQPGRQPRKQPCQLPLRPRQQPGQQPQQQPQKQPQQWPQQPPQQQPHQQLWQLQQQPQLQPWQQLCQQPWQPQQQPQQPQQLQQQPWQQQPWLQLRQQPQQPQLQPWQQPLQPQLQPWQQPQQPQLQPWQQPLQPQLQPWQQPLQPQLQPWQQPQQPQLQPWQQPQQPQLQSWQQPQQPQLQPWQQPQQFYQLISQLQQPIYHIQQSVSQHSSVQRSTHQRMILPARKTAISNPKRLGSNLQPQRVLGSQPSSTQIRPEQSHPPQSVHLPSAFQQQQQQPQQVQLRILQLPVPVPTVATQRAQPHHGQKAASQSKGIGHSGGLQQKNLHSQNSKTTLKNKKINH